MSNETNKQENGALKHTTGMVTAGGNGKLLQTCPIDGVLADRLFRQPVSHPKWVHRDELSANLYNPNKMAPPEMKLLKESIINDGWLFPICVLPKEVHIEGLTDNANQDKYTIIDGFHRYTISGDKDVMKLTDGYVPVVFPTGDDVMATTVRMNRVKGTHTVLGMADIVKKLIDDGKDLKYIMTRFGMEKEEVVRLAASKGIPASDIIVESEFSKAWVPGSKRGDE